MSSYEFDVIGDALFEVKVGETQEVVISAERHCDGAVAEETIHVRVTTPSPQVNVTGPARMEFPSGLCDGSMAKTFRYDFTVYGGDPTEETIQWRFDRNGPTENVPPVQVGQLSVRYTIASGEESRTSNPPETTTPAAGLAVVLVIALAAALQRKP